MIFILRYTGDSYKKMFRWKFYVNVSLSICLLAEDYKNWLFIFKSQDDAQEIAAVACESTESIYEFNGPQGIIQTAYFPDYYNNYENCMWYINPTNVDIGKVMWLWNEIFKMRIIPIKNLFSR